MQQISDTIAQWLREKVKEADAEGLVLGLSGGVDSATAAGVCVNACGNDNVAGVIMPCESHTQDEKDARLLADTFCIKTEYVDLTEPFQALESRLPPGNDLARANIKPRLRMITLYHIAQSRNYLVVGTGNKTECMVGYFTKYGDGGVDLLPLADFYKSEVRQLATHLQVPQSVIEKKPSAGLWENQSDEDELGISYETLDATLAAIETGSTDTIDAQTLSYVHGLIEKSAHKRALPPMCECAQPLRE